MFFDGLASTFSAFIGFDITGEGSESIVATNRRQSAHPREHAGADFTGIEGTVSGAEDGNDSGGEEQLWNLGESSFPLLPHAPHEFNDPFDEDTNAVASSETGRPQSYTVRNYFSSLLNNPHAVEDDDSAESLSLSLDTVAPLLDAAIKPVSVINALERVDEAAEQFRDSHRGEARSTTTDLTSPRLRSDLSACLHALPPSFVADEFDLMNEEIFAAHLDRVRLAKSAQAQRANTSDSILLQSTLSAQLDSVELNLFNQINARSHLFFSSLATLQSLQAQLTDSVEHVAHMRSNIVRVDTELVESALQIAHQHQKRANLAALTRKLDLIAAVTNTSGTVQLLLATGDYASALEVCQSTRATMEAELSGVQCVQTLDRKLLEQLKLIEKLIASEFHAILTHTSAVVDDDTRERLAMLVENLLRLGTFNAAVSAAKHAIQSSLHTTFEQQLQQQLASISSGAMDGMAVTETDSLSTATDSESRDAAANSLTVPTPTSAPVANSPTASVDSITASLASLSHAQFLKFLGTLFTMLMVPLDRLDAIRAMVAVQDSLVSDQPNTNTSSATGAAAMSELIANSCELLHHRVSKLLSSRSALTSSLSLADFRALLDFVLGFLHRCESLCSRQFYGLRGALLQQAKQFVGHFHRTSMANLASTLEHEKWQRVDVDVDFQHLIDQQFTRSNTSAGGGGGNESGAATAPTSSTVAVPERKVLFVPASRARSSPSAGSSESRSNFLKFPAVPSLLALLVLIRDYVALSSQLPALTLDSLQRLLELLTLFNSRVCQLVLGAGAMHLAGLKSITATHLALASQSIALVATQIPVIKQLFAGRLAAKHAAFLNGFDRVQRDCDEHVAQIREKLTSIMRELAATMTLKMREEILTVPERTGDADSEEDRVVAPIRTLLKQTASLHRALTDLLSLEERDAIFGAIGTSLSAAMVAQTAATLEAESAVDLSERRARLQANLVYVFLRVRALPGIREDDSKVIKAQAETLT